MNKQSLSQRYCYKINSDFIKLLDELPYFYELTGVSKED